MSEFARDVRFGLRLLARSPVFAVTAALLLAIGIGANAVIFSVVDAVMLRRLPVAHPERLVRIVEVHPTGFETWDFPYGLYEALARSGAPAFSDVFAEGPMDVALSDGAGTERVRIDLVSPNYFASLGVRPKLGRVLNAEDDRLRTPAAVSELRLLAAAL